MPPCPFSDSPDGIHPLGCRHHRFPGTALPFAAERRAGHRSLLSLVLLGGAADLPAADCLRVRRGSGLARRAHALRAAEATARAAAPRAPRAPARVDPAVGGPIRRRVTDA